MKLNELANKKLKQILAQAKVLPGLAKRGPRCPWVIQLQLLGKTSMTRLNSKYRGKNYATDVLSFPTGEPFRTQGILGEIVICLPTLKAQARAQNHSAQNELEILLVHGVLHLLGLDHEEGPRQAALMGRWERKLLLATFPSTAKRLSGLIDRSNSGIEKG